MDLISFLETYAGEQRSLTIRVPENSNELPAIEISRAMCQDLIMFAMERTQDRMFAEHIQV